MTTPTPPERQDPSLPSWARKASTQEPMAEERMAAFIGRHKWETVYRRKFAPFLDDPSFVPTWNWSAALATPYWFLYRKLYLGFFLFLLTPSLVASFAIGSEVPATPAAGGTAEFNPPVLSMAVLLAATMAAAGGTGNWLLFRRARAATHFVAMQQLPEAEAQEMLTRVGGVHRTMAIVFAALNIIFQLGYLAERAA